MRLRVPVGLAVAGRGVVCPGGCGLEALRAAAGWEPREEAGLGPGARPWAGCRAPEEAVRHWQAVPRLRRASALAYFISEAGQQALADCEVPRARVGLAAALFTGGLRSSRKFYEEVVKGGRKVASPAVFPETVSNSAVSHAVAALGLGGPVYALLGDETAWVSALETASLWLETGDAEAVLAVGGDELDAVTAEACRCAGWLPPQGRLVPSEGAGALCLRRGDGGPQVAWVAPGRAYARRREGAAWMKEMLEGAEGLVLDTVPPTWRESEVRGVAGGHQAYLPGMLRRAHPFTAGAAWQTLLALEGLGAGERRVVPVWGSNYQVGAVGVEG